MSLRNARAACLIGLAAQLGLVGLSGCDLAPVYQPPHPILPASYQGSGPFVVARPQDQLARGPWWRMFGDPVLDRLEDQLDAGNPDLQAAQEAYIQARDLAAEARSELYPQLIANGDLTENKLSVHHLFRTSTVGGNEATSNQISATASWEPDFWSAIRNRTKIYKEQAQEAAAQIATARLSLQTELASDYVAMRGLDAEHAVFGQTIAFYGKAVSITKLRLAGKIASGLDVARAQNQLSAAEALDTETLAQRALLQHAVAVLAGINPSAFMLPVQGSTSVDAALVVPHVPAGVPSALLQRRPDIAQAERAMAAANAAIGVARAAFYPDIRLSAISGFEDSGFNLASLPNSLWAVGAYAMLPLFEGGLRRAELQRNWSQLAQAGDNYRATTLTAFQQVEDGLVLTDRLATEAAQQQDAAHAADQAEGITLTLYTGGLGNYLDVTVAQIAALTAEIAEVQVQTRRLQATVSLIGALGGGWSTADMPTLDQTLPFDPLSLHDAPGDVHEAAHDTRPAGDEAR